MTEALHRGDKTRHAPGTIFSSVDVVDIVEMQNYYWVSPVEG